MDNYGFLLGVCIVLQIITGICLSMHYVPVVSYSFFVIKHIIRDIYNGSLLRYLHSNGESFTFLVLYIHICRSIIFQSYLFLFHTWVTGIFLYLFLLVIAFLGYVLPWGQKSFWGATVITNVLSTVPDLVEWICGSFFVYNPTLDRFFVLHFILPFLVMGSLLFHIFYLHLFGSSHPLICNSNNKIAFFSYIFTKDSFGFLVLLLLYFLQVGFGFLVVSHPDNALEVNILVTPFHIVPEWYFLSFYALLKTIPDKNSGINILIIIWICFMWIGAEIPKVNFICLCRFYI